MDKIVYRRVNTEEKIIAITFDDGPKDGTTDLLLDGLRERGASSTFFLVGEQAQYYPDLVLRMQQEGHQVGNHTWSHVRLEGKTPDELLQEIQHNETLLQEILGGEGYWIRPPYGVIAPELVNLIEVPMIKWSVDPRDWESRNREKIVEAVLKEAKPNSIVLMHDIYESTATAAESIIPALIEKGFQLVTVDELAYYKNKSMSSGQAYSQLR